MNIVFSLILGIVTVLSGYGFVTEQTPTEVVESLGSNMTGSAWFLNASQQIQAGAATWGLRVPSLVSCNTIDTDGNGVFTCGTDATGGGGGGGSISTSTIPVAGNLAYWTSGSALSDVATGTLTTSATGLELSATRGLVGGASILSLTSGYEIPTTTRMATWDAKGNGTVTSVDFSVPTGLSIANNPITTSGTLALTLTSGYVIPTTTREVNQDTAFLWGNHASQGYITDGNTNWDNSYGFVTEGQTVGTTSAGVAGQAAYWTGIRTLAPVATGTLTESVLGLDLDNSTRGLFGGAAAFSLTSGYAIPSTTRMALWDTASGTVTSVAMSVPTGLAISGTPITTSGTLALAYDTGYAGVLTASTTNWNTFYETPSNRISAGTGIDWSGNTLNGVYTAGDGLTLTTEDFDCDTASGSVFGCLTATDWNAFDDKVSSTSIDTESELETLLTDVTNVLTNNDTNSVTPDMVLSAGQTDEMCLTYETSGDTWEWATCGTGGGGSGGGWATTTDNNAEVAELVTTTGYDAYIGGTASTTAEFNFDKDTSKFTISSTTANATGTISSPSGGLIFGHSTGEKVELNFNTSNTLKYLSSTGIDLADYGAIGINSTASSSLSALRVSALKDSTWSLGTNGMVLQTNGSTAQWVATNTLGISGTGGGSISTSSIPVAPNLAYWTSPSTLSDVATGTLTTTATGLELSATWGLVGGASILSLTSGYAVPSTTRLVEHDTAFLWGNHASAGYDQVTTAGDGLTRTVNDFDCDIATSGVFGCLTSTDWNAFDDKVSSSSIDTLAEIETLTSVSNILIEADIDASSELSALMDDETGSLNGGLLVFSNAPTFLGTAAFNALTVTATSTLGFASSTALTVSGNTILTNATTTNLGVTTGVDLFGGGLKTSANALCIQLTGHADLCDGGDATGAGSAATGTMLVCATGCDYSSIQTALNDGFKNIQLKDETYAGPVQIKGSDTKIWGAGATSTLITCDASVNSNCFSIATSSRLTRVIIRDLAIDNTSGSLVGTGLDTSDTSKVFASNIRVTDFNIAHLHQDTTNSSFYSSFENMDYYASSTCFKTGGTKSNDNKIDTARCIMTAPTGIGYWFIDSEGWLLNNINAEPGTVIGTGLYVDATSIAITAVNPWFEGNATGTEIRAGALNTSIKGGRITAGTVGIYDGGTNTFLDSTLVSSNTTNHTCPTTCLGTYVNTSSSYATPHILVGTTTQNSAYNRLALNISTSEATANMFVLNNAGAFATAPAGIQFTHSSGGFPSGTARIYVNPGSSYLNAKMNLALANTSQVLTDRLTIDVDGDVGISTTSPEARLDVWGASSGKIATFFSDTGTKFMEMLNTGVTTLLGAWDFGGATSLEIPNGTGNTVDAIGELALDTTDDQLIMGDGGGTARVFGTDEFRVISATIASSSLKFASGKTLIALGYKDGLEITQFRCYVEGGTSKVVNLTDGTNDTETITCATTMTSDTDVATNDTFTADELGSIEMGATTGTVDYLHFEAWARITRE